MKLPLEIGHFAEHLAKRVVSPHNNQVNKSVFEKLNLDNQQTPITLLANSTTESALHYPASFLVFFFFLKFFLSFMMYKVSRFPLAFVYCEENPTSTPSLI